MAKKNKIPPMSEARKAIFARYNCDEAMAAKLHGQLTTHYDALLKLYAETAKLAFTDDREANGNLILVAHFESVAASEARLAARSQAAQRRTEQFQRVFKARLRNYFHPVFGFNVAQFDSDIAKSNDGESCKDAVRRQWGEEGLAIIVDLMGGAPAKPQF